MLLFGDRVVTVDDVCGEDVIYSCHHCSCNVIELFACCWDDQAHDVINVHFQTVSQGRCPSGCLWEMCCRCVPSRIVGELV
jgi:hypothetical protein